MMRLFKKRLEDTFRIGKENGFRKFFRNWLSADDFGIWHPRRTDKNPRNASRTDKQAAETVQSVPRSEPGSTATESPGNIDLYLLLKKRSETALSDKTAEDADARSAADSASGKAVQE
jgi:hypothetical protein